MKSIEPDEFFKQIAINSGITDLQLVRNFYYGMVKTISKQLTARQAIKLPDWGEFKLKIHKSRKFMSVNGTPGILPPIPTVKFSPDYKVKKFFQELGL